MFALLQDRPRRKPRAVKLHKAVARFVLDMVKPKPRPWHDERERIAFHARLAADKARIGGFNGPKFM